MKEKEKEKDDDQKEEGKGKNQEERTEKREDRLRAIPSPPTGPSQTELLDSLQRS